MKFWRYYLLTMVLSLAISSSTASAESIFKHEEKVETNEMYVEFIKDMCELDKRNCGKRTYRYGRVVDEKNGMVTIYDPVTKRSTQIFRGRLQLR